MSSEWATKRLGDCCEKIGSGATPKGGKEAYLDFGPVHLIRSQNVHNDGFSPSGLAYISEWQAQKLDNVKVESGDVLLNITGDSVARVCQALNRFLPARVNQHVAIIRPISSVFDARYLRYFFASPAQQNFMLGLAAVGATRNALTKGMIESFEVPCPPLTVQQGIADVLASLDNRITLLRETNTTLEAIAQALFKSWFVDFDPVHAKMQGRTPEGMDEATAALFPDSFEESELGSVPKGWRIGTLADLASFQNGYAFKSKDWSEAGHPVIKIGNVKPSLISFEGCSFVGAESVIGLDRFKLKRGDLLVGMTGYVGETGLVTKVSPAAYLNQRVGRIATSAGVRDLGFVFCLTRHEDYKSFAEGQSHGSAQANVSGSDLLKFKSTIPDNKVIRAFNEVMETLIESIMSNHEQAQMLGELRDTLLPKLVSGELPVSHLTVECEA